MRVAVIGAAGKMGQWLTRFFTDQGHQTVLFDVNHKGCHEAAKQTDSKVAKSIEEAVAEADLVLVSVPVTATPQVIHEAMSHMRQGSILSEISSVKAAAVEALRQAPTHGVRPLSIHPMFGPDTTSIKGMKVLLIPVQDEAAELSLAERLLPGAYVTKCGVEAHDRGMALVLSLPYFMNLIFARVLSSEDLEWLRGIAGTTFPVQLAVTEAVLDEKPGLITAILGENTQSQDYYETFLVEAKRVKALLERPHKEQVEALEELRAKVLGEQEQGDAGLRRFKAFEAIRG
jgi:prephenate dehydrogenase